MGTPWPTTSGTLGTSWPWGHHSQEHRAMMGTPRHPGDVMAMGTSRPGALPYGDTAANNLMPWGHRELGDIEARNTALWGWGHWYHTMGTPRGQDPRPTAIG